jgi:hypothetical protein
MYVSISASYFVGYTQKESGLKYSTKLRHYSGERIVI